MSTKYEKLKEHFLQEFPKLKFGEIASIDGEDNGAGWTLSTPHWIQIIYGNAAKMPFATLAHEVGHYLSFQRGHHDDAFRSAQVGIHTLFPTPEEISLFLKEEERAWKLGRAYAAKLGLKFTPRNITRMNWALNRWRSQFGLVPRLYL